MKLCEGREWSERLRQLTREALENVPVSPDGFLHMKHIEGRYGKFDLFELISGTFVLQPKGDGETLHFADATAVIAAGWVVD